MKTFTTMFTSRSITRRRFSWREALEGFRVAGPLLRALCLSLFDGLTKERCIAMHLFWRSCIVLARKSGPLFLALYLKECRVQLMKVSACDNTVTQFSVSVSCTKGGLPRIIPSFHRKAIRRGDTSVIQLYLSLFSASKFINLAPKIRRGILDTIIEPAKSGEGLTEMLNAILNQSQTLLTRYVPRIKSIPLKQGIEFVPTWKSVPSTAGAMAKCKSKELKRKSFFTAFPLEFSFFISAVRSPHWKDTNNPSCLWLPFVRYAFDDVTNDQLSGWSLAHFQSFGKRIFKPPSQEESLKYVSPGRLCAACTGEGKRRLFAIGNYVNQRLLYPYHQWLASVLRLIPMDGTFDQLAPLDRLKGTPGTAYSIDLKAATDRWPIDLLLRITRLLFGPAFGRAATFCSLYRNIFSVTFLKKRPIVMFLAGQPLGMYSSWPLFALSHHLVIWYAAEQVYPGKHFTRYAVLGDDVIIIDDAVNTVYRDVIAKLQVKTSPSKSLTSPTGAVEFAKRFRLSHLSVDVSALSLRKLMESMSPLGWYNLILSHHRELRLSTWLRLAGFGFRAASRPFSSRYSSRRFNRCIVLILFARCGSLTLSLTVAVGGVIPPYVLGRLFWKLFEYFTPKDLEILPEAAYSQEKISQYALERTVDYSWVRQYLSYLLWHVRLSADPEANLDCFMDAPVYIRTWYLPEVDLSTFRYGIMFRTYDWLLSMLAEDQFELPLWSSDSESSEQPNVIYTVTPAGVIEIVRPDGSN